MAWDRVDEASDPTSETLYLADDPAPSELSPQTRSVYLKDAYNTGKALEKAGWIVFESEEAISIRLTDEGTRVGS